MKREKPKFEKVIYRVRINLCETHAKEFTARHQKLANYFNACTALDIKPVNPAWPCSRAIDGEDGSSFCGDCKEPAKYGIYTGVTAHGQ